nr:MAG TPA: hypothetical protein [Caudoviricetes sp.]
MKFYISMFPFPTMSHRGGGYGIFVCCLLLL